LQAAHEGRRFASGSSPPAAIGMMRSMSVGDPVAVVADAAVAGEDKLAIKVEGQGEEEAERQGQGEGEGQRHLHPTGGTPNTEDKKIKLVKR
jgi:hypothetical protein